MSLNHRRSLPKSCAGVALIVVLWLIVLLTMLGVAVSVSSVSQRRAAERYGQTAVYNEMADSAIRLTLLQLLSSTTGSATQAASQRTLALWGQPIAVVVEREAGRVDLNIAPEALLMAIFAANDWDKADAQSIAAKIVGWRDTNSTSDDGASEVGYQLGSKASMPRNGPFQSVDELRQLLDGEVLDADLLDAFTVYTHLEFPRESAAPLAVMRGLTWADQNKLLDKSWIQRNDKMPNNDTETSSVVGETIRISACVHHDRYETCRRAITRLTGNLVKPYQVFDWRSIRASN